MNKTIISFLVIFILFLSSITLKGSEDYTGITVYKHANFQGPYKFIPIGQNIRSLRDFNFNDKISSIKLMNSGIVEVFENDNFLGSSTIIKDHIYDLKTFFQGGGGDWNDRISSLKVSNRNVNTPPIYNPNEFCFFYKAFSQIGVPYKSNLGNYSNISNDWNNKINSVWIREGYKLILYEFENFKGKQLTLLGKLGGSFYNLFNENFSNKISSYRINPIPGYIHNPKMLDKTLKRDFENK